MEDTAVPGAAPLSSGAPWSFPRRFVALFTSPKALFEELERRPSWFVPFLVAILLVALYSLVLWQPVLLPEALAKMEDQGASDQAVQMITKNGLMFGLVFGSVFAALLTFVFAVVVWAIGGFMLGGTMSYKQALSITTHAGLVSVPAMAVMIPLALVSKMGQVSVGPGMLFPMATAEGFGGRFLSIALSSVDLFRLWQIALIAVGVSVIGRVPRAKATTAMFITYFVFSIAMAAVFALIPR